MTQPNVGIAIVGAGKIAERHVAAYRLLGCSRLFLSDVDAEVGRQRAQQWGIEFVSQPARLLAREDLAVVNVCTPTPYHAEYVLQALDAGKHVFCEKPLARTAAEAQAIREASRRNQKIVMTGYLYRFHPAFQFVKSLLEQRIIGTPYFALMRLGGRGSASAWKHTAGQGAGAMGEMMAHMIDLATWYFGPTRQATSLWHTTIAPQRVINEESVRATAEDVSVIRLLSGGVQILCESDLLTPSYMQYVEIQGDNGSIFASMLHYLPTVLYCKEPRGIYDRGNSMYSFPQENLFVRELQCFLEAVERNHWELNGLDDSVHVVELLEQLHRGPERRARS